MATQFDNIKYRTADGRADYVFKFVYVSSKVGWRAYIVQQPPYRGRDEGAHPTHRLGGPGERYVCWTKPFRTLQEAKNVAALWADCTQEYIRTGKFDEPPNRPEVTDDSSMARFRGTPAAAGEPRSEPPSIWDRARRFLTE